MDTSKPKKPMPKGVLMPKPKAKKVMPVDPMEDDDGPMPPEIAGKLQDIQNEKGYQNYQKNRSLSEPFKKGGKVGSASKRADGCAQRGKTRGKMV